LIKAGMEAQLVCQRDTEPPWIHNERVRGDTLPVSRVKRSIISVQYRL
jgi:hypothetical protein